MTTVYLTFDDGPHAVHTPAVLDVLSRYRAHATFFQIGQCIAAHPELTRRVADEGHGVGNHTWSHPDLSQLDRPAFEAEVGRTNTLLTEPLCRAPSLFRPPYGRMSETTRRDAAEAGLETVLWDVDPEDWDCPGTAAIVSRVLGTSRPGAIVLFHDGGGDRSQTVAALEEILAELAPRGFTFPPLPG